MFEEMIAKLGLDISGFVKGLAAARSSIGELTRETGKKLFDLKDVSRTLATALGLNLQSIAEKVARFVTGFSKDQEQALADLVNATGKAADAQVAALDAARQKNKKMAEDVAKDEEAERFSRLSDEKKLDQLYAKRTQLMQRAANTREGSGINLQARADLIEVNKEIAKVSEERFNKEKERAAKLKDAEEKLAETAKANALDQASDAKKLEILKNDIAEAQAQVVAAGQDEVAVAQAKIVLEEARGKLAQEAARQQDAANKKQQEADDKRKKALEDIAAAEERAAKAAQSMRDARKATVLPSMADVTSGRRNIGSGARRTATMLERERERSTRLADQVQRNAEAVDTAKTPDERKQAQRALDASRAALAQSQSRIRAGEAALGNRVSDANPFAAMEKQLGEINAEIKKLNDTTLAPSSVSTT